MGRRSFSTSATINHDFGGDYQGYARVEYDYVSKTQLTETTPPNLSSWDQNVVNASLGVKFNEGKWVLTVKGTNLTNEEIQQHVFGDILKRSLTAELRVSF